MQSSRALRAPTGVPQTPQRKLEVCAARHRKSRGGGRRRRSRPRPLLRLALSPCSASRRATPAGAGPGPEGAGPPQCLRACRDSSLSFPLGGRQRKSLGTSGYAGHAARATVPAGWSPVVSRWESPRSQSFLSFCWEPHPVREPMPTSGPSAYWARAGPPFR